MYRVQSTNPMWVLNEMCGTTKKKTENEFVIICRLFVLYSTYIFINKKTNIFFNILLASQIINAIQNSFTLPRSSVGGRT